MNAMQIVPGAASAATPPAAVAAAASTGLGAADQAFDDVFCQLTGGLLATCAVAGAAVPAAGEAPVEAGEDDAAEDGDAGLPLAFTVPVTFTLPVAAPPVATSDATTASGPDRIAHEALRNGVAAFVSGGRGATTVPAAAVVPGASALAPAAAPLTPGAALTVGETPAVDQPDTFEVATTLAGTPVETLIETPVEAPSEMPVEASASIDEMTAVEGVAPPVVPTGAAAASETRPADAPAPGTQSTAPAGEAHVRGLDGRRGMRETPARARTSETTTGSPSLPVSTTTATPTPSAAGEATPEAAPAQALPPQAAASAPAAPTALPASAERAFALQRALARQTERSSGDTPAPGLVAQAAIAVTGTGTPNGAETGADTSGSSRRQGRPWQGVMPAGAAASTPAQAPVAAAASGTEAAPAAGPAVMAAWRAALASTSTDAASGSVAEPQRTVVPGAPVMAPAFELPITRERAALALEAPVAARELDAGTADAVHTQIVKSMRLQWSGGAGEARVTLKPEYLGDVVATIKVDQGVVTATLHADTPEVRRVLEAQTASLREALVDHGLRLDKVVVAEPETPSGGEPGRQSRPRPRQPQTPQRRARRDADSGATFELTTE